MKLNTLSKIIFLASLFIFNIVFGGNSSSSGFTDESRMAKILRIIKPNSTTTYECYIYPNNVKLYEKDILILESTKELSKEIIELIHSLPERDLSDFEKHCESSEISDYIFVEGKKQILSCKEGNRWIYLDDSYPEIQKVIESSCRL